MADPLSAIGSALLHALTGPTKSLMDWIVRNVVSVLLSTWVCGALLEASANKNGLLTLSPDVAAYRVLYVLGVDDTTWLDRSITWLERTELAPTAIGAAVFAGVLVFSPARYSNEAAWLLIIPTSITLGASIERYVLGGWAVTTLVLATISAIKCRERPHDGRREWFAPSLAIQIAVYGMFSFGLTPVILFIRTLNGVIDSVTYERKVEPAAGAAPVQIMRRSTRGRTAATASDE